MSTDTLRPVLEARLAANKYISIPVLILEDHVNLAADLAVSLSVRSTDLLVFTDPRSGSCCSMISCMCDRPCSPVTVTVQLLLLLVCVEVVELASGCSVQK